MKPIYFEVDGHLPLVVVPEVRAEMDGHPILTLTMLFTGMVKGNCLYPTKNGILITWVR